MYLFELLALYETHHLSGKPSATYYHRLIQQVMGPLNDLQAEHSSKITLLQWFTPLKATPGHANKALGCLRAAYRWGISNGLITCTDPTIGIQKCPERMRSVTTSPQEWAKIVLILEDLRLRHRTFFWHQYLMGQRPGQTRTTKPEWIKLECAIPHIAYPLTKNGRPQVVPIPEELCSLFRLLLRINPPQARWLYWGHRPSDVWGRTSAQKMWERIRAEAGLSHLWLNDLRRSTASDLLNQGESLGIVQGQLGHRSLSQTAKYAWLAMQPLAVALQKRTDMITAHTDRVMAR